MALDRLDDVVDVLFDGLDDVRDGFVVFDEVDRRVCMFMLLCVCGDDADRFEPSRLQIGDQRA